MKTQDMMSGYAMLERPRRKVTVEGAPRSFEILDTEAMTKETFNIEGQKPKKRRKASNAEPKTIMDTVEPPGLPEGTTKVVREPVVKPQEPEEDCAWSAIEADAKYDVSPKAERLEKTIKVHTDITEVTIGVAHVHMDGEVVCIFMYKDSNTKLKPKKGTEMEIEVDGEKVSVYSPGVYISADPFDCDMVFLLVLNSNDEYSE